MLNPDSKLVALVPARAGSKRLPGKNTKLLAGKPLIQWTIEAAFASNMFAKVLVSTDSEEIAQISKAAGADVPWLRPLSLGTDSTTSTEVIIHSLSYLMDTEPTLDTVMLLQPTSPFRRASSIQNAVDVFQSFERMRPVVSISQIKKSLSWYRWRDIEGNLSPVLPAAEQSQSEDAYIFDGLLYLSSFTMFLENNGFLCDKTYGLITEYPEERIDIDDESDWKLAELFVS